MAKQANNVDLEKGRSNELGIAERTRKAVEQGMLLTQAQMLGIVPLPKQYNSKDREVQHR